MYSDPNVWLTFGSLYILYNPNVWIFRGTLQMVDEILNFTLLITEQNGKGKLLSVWNFWLRRETMQPYSACSRRHHIGTSMEPMQMLSCQTWMRHTLDMVHHFLPKDLCYPEC